MTGDWRSVTLADMQELRFSPRGDGTGVLVAMQEHEDLPMGIVRVFTVISRGARADRGRHALLSCGQVLVCLHGAIDVRCDDGRESRTVRLDAPDRGLFLPAAIWRETVFHSDGAVLMALCDQPYDPNDYINDYDEFVARKRDRADTPQPRRAAGRG